jgi:hypothetical protein
VVFPFQHDTLASTWAAVDAIAKSPTVMLYIGPDQIMPLTSVFGAIVGVALMFWGHLVGLVTRCWSAIRRSGPAPDKAASPASMPTTGARTSAGRPE